jgi:predicted nucleic acid-binding protein
LGSQEGAAPGVILLDTSVVSAVLRRRRRGGVEQKVAETVARLLDTDIRVALPGIVFQEILSGIAQAEQVRRVRRSIHESFPILLATEQDHIAAAELVNVATARGLALSTPDALIAAQAIVRGATLLTTDVDFTRLAAFARLKLSAWE